MPRFIPILLVRVIMSLLTAHHAQAQGMPDIAVNFHNGPDLVSGANTLHVGSAETVNFAPAAEKYLEMRNIGTARLSSLSHTIVGPHASLFSVSLRTSVLDPLQTSLIDVSFKPTLQSGVGTFTVTLRITSNDPDENPFEVTLTGVGVAPEMVVKLSDETEIQSGDSLSFGSAAVGKTVEKTFTVKNAGNTLLHVDLWWTAGDYYQIYWLDSSSYEELDPGESATFIVRYSPPRAGTFAAELTLFNNDPNKGSFKIQCSGSATAPKIEVRSPAGTILNDGISHSFQSVHLGKTKNQTFTVTNTGQEPLKNLVLSVEPGSSFTIIQGLGVTEIPPGGTANFTVQFAPTFSGNFNSWLFIGSNDPDDGGIELRLTGVGSQPQILVHSFVSEIEEGGNFYLGNRRVGVPTLFELTIRNAGLGQLYVDHVEMSGAYLSDFTLQSPPTQVYTSQTSQGLALRFYFVPKAYGTRNVTLKIFSDDEDQGVFEFTVSGNGLLPDIQLEEPANTPVPPPFTRNFGPRAVNSAGTNLTFTIKNPGNQDLTLARSITGAHAADFSVVEPFPTTPVPAGSSTTLTMQFTPQSPGERQAVLELRHNAVPTGQGLFQVHLRGTGVYSEVALSSSTYYANHGQTEATVTLQRDETRVPASIELQTLAGTASSVPPVKGAQPGEDFTPMPSPTVVNFAIGEEEKTVSIPLLAPASGAAETRQFLVRLINPGAGVMIQQPEETLVRIVGTDSTKPTLTLTTPAAGKVGAVLPLVVSGKAGDAKGIDRVEVKLGSADPVLATLSPNSTKPTDVPFTCELSPADGTYTLVVTAYDLRGNSTSVTRGITFTRRHTLTVKLVDGSADPVGLPGTLAMTATPAAAAAPLKTDPTDALIKTTTVVPGTQVKLVATPKAGYVFGRWLVLNSNGNVVHTGPELTFTMPDTGLTVEAMLVPSPFAPLPGHNNSLHWMLVPAESTEAPLTAPQFGYLSGTITLKGGFTGKLLMNGQTLPVTATFYGDGPAFFTVAGQKRDSLPVPGGNLKLYYEYLPATLTSPTGELLAMADLQHGLAKAPASLLNSATKGTYTVRLNPAPEPLEPATSPQASGYATMTLSNTGVISLAGALADGTAVTQTSALLPGNKAPVFIQLPTPGGTTKLGLLTGLLDFDTAPADTDVTGDLAWFRPAAATAKVLLYNAGWPAGISLDAEGALYSATKTAQTAFFGLTSITPSPARLHFSGGKLTGPIEKTSFGLKGNTVLKTAPVDNSYTLTIAPATGIFSGAFIPNWSNLGSAKPTFRGVILQKGTASAAGFFINNAKGETTPESGAVTLGPPQL